MSAFLPLSKKWGLYVHCGSRFWCKIANIGSQEGKQAWIQVQVSFEWQSLGGRTLWWATISPCSEYRKMKVTIPRGSRWNASMSTGSHSQPSSSSRELWMVLSDQIHAEPKGSLGGLRAYSTDVRAINWKSCSPLNLLNFLINIAGASRPVWPQSEQVFSSFERLPLWRIHCLKIEFMGRMEEMEGE